jgi:hypothetical protein
LDLEKREIGDQSSEVRAEKRGSVEQKWDRENRGTGEQWLKQERQRLGNLPKN